MNADFQFVFLDYFFENQIEVELQILKIISFEKTFIEIGCIVVAELALFNELLYMC